VNPTCLGGWGDQGLDDQERVSNFDTGLQRLQRWAGGSVSWRAAPRRLRVAARRTVWRMVEASGACTRAAPSPLEAIHSTARRSGGKRCQHEGCSKAAVEDGTLHCKAHGGGRRCQHEGCTKAAATGGTPHCQAHGGGKRCQQDGCTKPVARGSVSCRLCPPSAQPDDA
jgi:hypothetical protein